METEVRRRQGGILRMTITGEEEKAKAIAEIDVIAAQKYYLQKWIKTMEENINELEKKGPPLPMILIQAMGELIEFCQSKLQDNNSKLMKLVQYV